MTVLALSMRYKTDILRQEAKEQPSLALSPPLPPGLLLTTRHHWGGGGGSRSNPRKQGPHNCIPQHRRHHFKGHGPERRPAFPPVPRMMIARIRRTAGASAPIVRIIDEIYSNSAALLCLRGREVHLQRYWSYWGAWHAAQREKLHKANCTGTEALWEYGKHIRV